MDADAERWLDEVCLRIHAKDIVDYDPPSKDSSDKAFVVSWDVVSDDADGVGKVLETETPPPARSLSRQRVHTNEFKPCVIDAVLYGHTVQDVGSSHSPKCRSNMYTWLGLESHLRAACMDNKKRKATLIWSSFLCHCHGINAS